MTLSFRSKSGSDCVADYFRCSTSQRLVPRHSSSGSHGFFRFGEAICHGNLDGGHANKLSSRQYDALNDVEIDGDVIRLPFDPAQAIADLQCESYIEDWRQSGMMSLLAKGYYFLRPLLPVAVRRHLQKIHLRGWDKVPFPHWPVDTSVDTLLHELLRLHLRSGHSSAIPFIWFWPEGSSSCAIMTHDVETLQGRDYCEALMDIDDSFGIKASFQVIPEDRYSVSEPFLDSIRKRDFEVVVHDLNHDGHLYKNRKQFLTRVAKINAYGQAFGAQGFRAGVLYRKQLWYDALQFSYDMSVPNVAHLDPQRGGCCTVMPFFVGNILEIPVTTTQDYTLFNILGDYSTNLWKQQIALIMEKHGLMSFIVHPDYVVNRPEQEIFKQLLAHLTSLHKERGVWLAKPGEVNRWWRQRAAMKLVQDESGWHVEGEGSERACIAYASECDGKISFSLETGRPAEVPKFFQAQKADLSASG